MFRFRGASNWACVVGMYDRSMPARRYACAKVFARIFSFESLCSVSKGGVDLSLARAVGGSDRSRFSPWLRFPADRLPR